jgi:hypothetical protein
MFSWKGDWIGKPRDLELIEKNDLQQMLRDKCAKLVKDSRHNVGAFLIETLTEKPVRYKVYEKVYLIYLQGGLHWDVPFVKVRLVYDLRGSGIGKIHMSNEDFFDLYETYFPTQWKDTDVVEGLQAQLHRVKV